jgi:tetratricopeptide (TPR) repeat protein
MKKKQAKAAPKAARTAKPAARKAGPKAGPKANPKAKAPSKNPPSKSAEKASKLDKAMKPAKGLAKSPAKKKAEAKPKARRGGAAAPRPSRIDAPAPKPAGKAADPEIPAPEERAGLEKVMASLTQIFGGRDFMSDAELDALLDDKMANGEIPPSAALDPLDEAQSLIYEAWNSDGPRKLSLARMALELSQDCADAFLILAQEEAKTREAALELYRKAYEAGRRALDPAIFAEAEGEFWSVMETRPYMRARLALAESLWDLGRKEEALGHLRELMRLNPSDNQGVRYILLQCLLESGADEELADLLDRYGRDPSSAIAYTRALWQFRRAGRGKLADGALAEALRANPHVPAYLLKRKALPARAPSSAGMGSAEEAEAYAAGALGVWHQTLGAVDWLASRI